MTSVFNNCVKIAVALLLLAPPLFAQPLFYSQSLQKLYYSLPSACRIENPSADTVVVCSGIVQGVTVPVAYSEDSYGILVHVGYRFLPYHADTHSFHLAVLRFLEREILALLVAGNLEEKLTLNRENGLILLHNGNTPRNDFYRSRTGLPDMLQRVAGFDIRYDEGKGYRVDLNCGQGQTLTFIFIADAELLSDMDKKERDERLAAQLSHHKAKSAAVLPHVPACDVASLQLLRDADTHDTIYICMGNSFIIPQINNNLYYQLKNDDAPELAFTLKWPSQTLSNVLLASTERDYTVRITHSQYGGIVFRYEMKYSDFYDYFSNGYDMYFGIETIDRDRLNGTLALADRSAGSTHIAQVSVTLSDLLVGGVMEIQLNSNIPQHNIESLFGSKAEDRGNEKYRVNIK